MNTIENASLREGLIEVNELLARVYSGDNNIDRSQLSDEQLIEEYETLHTLHKKRVKLTILVQEAVEVFEAEIKSA